MIGKRSFIKRVLAVAGVGGATVVTLKAGEKKEDFLKTTEEPVIVYDKYKKEYWLYTGRKKWVPYYPSLY